MNVRGREYIFKVSFKAVWTVIKKAADNIKNV